MSEFSDAGLDNRAPMPGQSGRPEPSPVADLQVRVVDHGPEPEGHKDRALCPPWGRYEAITTLPSGEVLAARDMEPWRALHLLMGGRRTARSALIRELPAKGYDSEGQSCTARDTVFVAGPHHVETASGLYVDLLAPDPATITLADVAHHLAQTNRYTGACRRPLNVAEHALLVADRLRSRGHDAATILLGLHHDDAEAYAQDITRPLKLALARGYQGDSNYAQIEKGLHSAIHVAIGLPDWTNERRAAVRAADDWALAAEAWHLLPSKGEGWFCWGLYDPDDPRNPRRAIYLPWDAPQHWLSVCATWLAAHGRWTATIVDVPGSQ